MSSHGAQRGRRTLAFPWVTFPVWQVVQRRGGACGERLFIKILKPVALSRGPFTPDQLLTTWLWAQGFFKMTIDCAKCLSSL